MTGDAGRTTTLRRCDRSVKRRPRGEQGGDVRSSGHRYS